MKTADRHRWSSVGCFPLPRASEDACYEGIVRMKKAELRQTLLVLLSDGPEWQYHRFVTQNGLDEE